MPDLYKLVVTTAQENKIKAAITGIFVVCVLIAFAWNRYEAREDREWAEREFYFHVEEDFPSAKLLSFYHDDVFTGRPAWWFKFSVPPAEVPGVEQHYKDNWKKDRRDGYVKADTNIYVAEDRDPKWWHPDKLLNADAFEFGPQPGMWLCISRSTGEAYLCISGT